MFSVATENHDELIINLIAKTKAEIDKRVAKQINEKIPASIQKALKQKQLK